MKIVPEEMEIGSEIRYVHILEFKDEEEFREMILSVVKMAGDVFTTVEERLRFLKLFENMGKRVFEGEREDDILLCTYLEFDELIDFSVFMYQVGLTYQKSTTRLYKMTQDYYDMCGQYVSLLEDCKEVITNYAKEKGDLPSNYAEDELIQSLDLNSRNLDFISDEFKSVIEKFAIGNVEDTEDTEKKDS